MFMKPLGSREECLGTTLFDAYHGQLHFSIDLLVANGVLFHG